MLKRALPENKGRNALSACIVYGCVLLIGTPLSLLILHFFKKKNGLQDVLSLLKRGN